MHAPSTDPALFDFICQALRDERPAWPWGADEDAQAALLAMADRHGVTVMLHEKADAAQWPGAVLAALRDRAIHAAMWELRHQQVISDALAAPESAGAVPILLKGTALAYSAYANPAHRMRADTDLLVTRESRRHAEAALRALGFQRDVSVTGELVSYQANYTRAEADGTLHTIDLHWKINNSEMLSGLFTHEELLANAQPIPLLGPQARGTSFVDAMLIACMHRASHRTQPYYVDGTPYYDPGRLIWLADVDLLARSMGASGWSQALRSAERKGLRQVVAESLSAASAAWKTPVPRDVLADFNQEGPEGLASRYLAAEPSRQRMMDWQAHEGWAARIRWLLETAFPDRAYMHQRFADVRPQWLPWLYCRRAALGVIKRLSLPSQRAP